VITPDRVVRAATHFVAFFPLIMTVFRGDA
jgi:hypothetical protein